MAKREEATPETNPKADDAEGPPPSVKEESEVDEKLDPDQETMQPDSS